MDKATETSILDVMGAVSDTLEILDLIRGKLVADGLVISRLIAKIPQEERKELDAFIAGISLPDDWSEGSKAAAYSRLEELLQTASAAVPAQIVFSDLNP